jgi:hypothetical protein
MLTEFPKNARQCPETITIVLRMFKMLTENPKMISNASEHLRVSQESSKCLHNSQMTANANGCLSFPRQKMLTEYSTMPVNACE